MVKQSYEKVPQDGQRTFADSQKDAGFFSILTFWWMNGVFKTGAKRPLKESDFLPLQDEDDTQRLTERIQEKWVCERKRCAESGNEPRFWKNVLTSVSRRQCVVIFITGLLDSLCRDLQPLLVGFLLLEMMSTRVDSFLYTYATAMFFTAAVRISANHLFFYYAERLGIQLRAGLKGVVYFKVLRLGQQTLRDFTVGQVVDLISNDVQRMEQAPRSFFCLLQSLFYLIIGACLAGYFVGFQAVVGLASVQLLVPLLVCLARVGGKLRKKTAEVTDRRVLLMNEIVSAIRAVKANAWEWVYRDKIRKIRREEIKVIRKKCTVLSFAAGPLFGFSDVASFIAVTLMVMTGHLLTPGNVFMLLAFIKTLITSFAYRAGLGLQFLVEAKVSLARIQKFLLLPSLPRLSETSHTEQARSRTRSTRKHTEQARSKHDPVMNNIVSHASTPTEYQDGTPASCNSTQAEDTTANSGDEISNKACTVANLTLCLGENSDRYTLHNISFELSQNGLVVITGSVGSGKSSVLAAINKQVEISEGRIVCPGTIAYVSQTPWVFPGTILENILFGKEFDEERFKAVIDVCALRKDLEIFPDGDQAIVGERGAVLSGGQQARISLARAAYADADVYLLDDPLSTVDAKVGQHIFEKCICDFLSSKTRIFVTHQTNHMKMADQIVLLSKGEVLAQGSYAEMSDTGLLETVLDFKKSSVNLDRQSDNKPTEHLREDVKTGLEIPDEDRRIGTLPLKLYWKYFRAGQSTLAMIGLVAVFLFTQALLVAPDIWLSHLVKKPKEEQRTETNMTIYLGFVCGILLVTFTRAVLFYQASLSSSEQLHDQMVRAILKAPVLFFDTNPVGRILNRFSKDVGCMDEVLPTCFLNSIQLALFVTVSILMPLVLNPWLMVVVVPVLLGYFCIIRYYLKSSRELRRLESICRSPIFSHVSETLNGLDTIRSRGRQDNFVLQFYRLQNKQNQVSNMCLASVRWMGVRVDFFSALLIGAVAFSAILVAQDPAQAGLSLIYVIETINVVQFAIQQASDVENKMTSIERVMTYTEIESEPGYDVDTKPPEDWPRDPRVVFSNVSLRYYPGGPQVLKDLNINIDGKAQIGVAGRTGAGKSSIITALLRMPEATGVISIDGINLATLNLQESRRCVSVLSQNPVLFSGSLRKNLDPLTQHEDADLWRVLEDVQLKTLVEHLEGHLDYQVSEGGGNFSVGERQLLCLARVLLQRNKVLILDEPTAHVDPSTERTIQNTVRDQLKECTVITVAHRLNTIRDCDKILVMEDGTAVEFDNYEKLMKKEDGVFAEMAEKQS